MGKLWENFKASNTSMHGIKFEPIILREKPDSHQNRIDEFMMRLRYHNVLVARLPNIIIKVNTPMEYTKKDWQNFPRKKKKIVKASMLKFNELLRKV